ncbi:hypothetical protein CFP65_7484 [Kitasatospora sp. MMS16-BH015]|uniref:hypothetical protein n=1 Tax=Kitasatospora sp. MMS16-BH015 TaxID=2018025 RepID=UPI000CA24737|nr:hypothetical protein [Kitasatospora sp. MMS16-BH015]AUG82063.1 hypothetical protein CFP65_7484 [Kitasatospora sp. MMS16-BH015]
MQRGVLLICATLGLGVVLCLWFARGIHEYRENLLLNLAPELLTTIATLLVIQPIVTRLEEDRVREHLRLDYGSFCDLLTQTHDLVCILDTYSPLFAGTSQRFAEATRAAIANGATMQIMLLDPDSLAAQQRSHELSTDVRGGVLRNIREFRRVQNLLPNEQRGRLQMRLYDAAPSIQLYRCGERMMVSFFPVDRHSGDTQQLEVRVTTPLGSFVAERFAELWTSGRSVNELLKKKAQLLDDSGAIGKPLWLDYVRHQGEIHVSDHRLLVALARSQDQPVRVLLGGHPSEVFELGLVDDHETDLLRQLAAAQLEKYGTEGHTVFMRLRPLPRQSRPTFGSSG